MQTNSTQERTPGSLHPVVRRYGPWICKPRPAGDWVVDQIDRETMRVRRYGPYQTEAQAREGYADLAEVSPNHE